MAPEGGTPAPGVLLGARYRLERRIASGGMATVWLAQDTELERHVAVKVLSDVLADKPDYVARFRREARVAARLENPNLVGTLDYSGEQERPYIVMEYVAGGTLADRIAAGGAGHVDPERLARQLLSALAAIHAAGVVHRDVKPSNVLLDRAGDARLTDFGIAQPDDATQLTATGEVIGTLKYMAPEVLAGEAATERSDLYALGVVLGEALGDAATPQLKALIDRLTAADALDRPASARQAMTLLDTYEERATTATVPLGAARSSDSRVIELNAGRVLAAVVAMAIVGGIVAVAVAGGGSGRTPAAAVPDKRAHHTTTRVTTAIAPPATTTSTVTAPAPAPAPAPEHPPKPPEEHGPPKIPPGQAKKTAEGD